MPLKMQVGQPTKEHASQANFTRLDTDIVSRFRRGFNIPQCTPVDGILLGKKSRIYPHLRDEHIIPSLKSEGVDVKFRGDDVEVSVSRLNAPVTIQLPPVFEDGTLTIKMEPGFDNGKFHSVLQFTSDPDLAVHYHTSSRDTVCGVVSINTYLATLPKEVLQSVQRRLGPMIVIYHPVPAEDKYIGNSYGVLFRLAYDHSNGAIQASRIEVTAADDHERWKKYNDACNYAINTSIGVFFISD